MVSFAIFCAPLVHLVHELESLLKMANILPLVGLVTSGNITFTLTKKCLD